MLGAGCGGVYLDDSCFFLSAVEQHYDGNKERNARVREDFPKAKEEQEKEIIEAAEKYRQMVRQQ